MRRVDDGYRSDWKLFYSFTFNTWQNDRAHYIFNKCLLFDTLSASAIGRPQTDVNGEQGKVVNFSPAHAANDLVFNWGLVGAPPLLAV